jgi:heme exporter protein D
MPNKTRRCEIEWPGPDSWSAGGVWLLYTLFYGFMPLWLGVLAGLGFSNQRIAWPDFLVHGELLIYAASLTAASTRLIASDLNTKRPFVHRQIFNLMSHAVILPSAAAYAIVKVLTFLNLAVQIKTSFMVWLSLPMVVISVVFSFLVFVLDHQRTTTPVNIIAEANREQEQLGRDFDRLEEAAAAEPPETAKQA